MYSEDETHYPGTDDPPAMIWSLCLQKVLVTAKWARRYLGSSLGLCCSAPIRTPWLPMTLRNNLYQLGVFFSDVAIQGEPGFHWAGVEGQALCCISAPSVATDPSGYYPERLPFPESMVGEHCLGNAFCPCLMEIWGPSFSTNHTRIYETNRKPNVLS